MFDCVVCLALLPKQPLLELSPLVLYSMLTPATNTVPINITSPWLKPLVDYCSFLPSNMTHHMQLKVIKATIANLAILRRITWIVSATDANPEVESAIKWPQPRRHVTSNISHALIVLTPYFSEKYVTGNLFSLIFFQQSLCSRRLFFLGRKEKYLAACKKKNYVACYAGYVCPPWPTWRAV